MITTLEGVKQHIDELITYWRRERDKATRASSRWTAMCYVDNLQCLRHNIFDETLPAEDGLPVVIDVSKEKKDFEKEVDGQV